MFRTMLLVGSIGIILGGKDFSWNGIPIFLESCVREQSYGPLDTKILTHFLL